jgi:soluble lytic murein transglycosylase-like protein
MRAAATALALAVLTIPATAFDPAQNLQQAPSPAKRAAKAPEKIQDRIAPGGRLRVAFLPEFLAPAASAPKPAFGWSGELDAQIARHALANGVPIELARRVVKRESGGNPRAVSKGNYGLMQIRLGTAKAMGYRGNAQGLLDAETNMTYAMRYLSGALRAAGGNHDRAVALYARGYYPEAKKMGFSPYNPPRAAGLAPLTTTR